MRISQITTRKLQPTLYQLILLEVLHVSGHGNINVHRIFDELSPQTKWVIYIIIIDLEMWLCSLKDGT